MSSIYSVPFLTLILEAQYTILLLSRDFRLYQRSSCWDPSIVDGWEAVVLGA